MPYLPQTLTSIYVHLLLHNLCDGNQHRQPRRARARAVSIIEEAAATSDTEAITETHWPMKMPLNS